MDYFVTNFPLICIIIAMGYMTYVNFKSNKKSSADIFVILSLCLVLSVIVTLENYAKSNPNLIALATWMSFLGYIIRPVSVYFFIRIADRDRVIPAWVFIVLMSINVLFYIPALFINNEVLSHFCFYYKVNAAGDGLEFTRGTFNFSSHIISGLLLIYVVYLSFRLISLKHREDAVMVLTCALFVVAAVLLEAFQVAENLLNVTIAISCVFYYLFFNRDDNRRDALTHLFNRKTYYTDLLKGEKRIKGVISIDMNGLKLLNDNKGHEEGDRAIRCVADSITKSIKRDMLGYRMGGDEFIITSLSGQKDVLVEVANKIKAMVDENGYSCSVGIACRENSSVPYDSLIKDSEAEMYKDKAKYYEDNKIERRKKEVA